MTGQEHYSNGAVHYSETRKYLHQYPSGMIAEVACITASITLPLDRDDSAEDMLSHAKTLVQTALDEKAR